MKRSFIAILTAITLLLSLVGCQSDTSSPEPAPAHTPTAVNLTDDIPPAANVKTIAPDTALMSDFAVSLLQATHQNGTNTLVSPLSVMCALAMATSGADGETLSQMEQVLGLPAPELADALHGCLSAAEQSDAWHLANSVWLADDAPAVQSAFLESCKNDYCAEVFEAPFDHTTVSDINHWVHDHTDGMIGAVLDDIPADAMMYLVNALAFEASWVTPYEEPHHVTDSIFTTEYGEQQAVDMMVSTEQSYLETPNATGFMKPYNGGYAFAALLPNEGVSVDELVASLDGNTLSALLTAPQDHAVTASLPSFSTSFDTDLSETLEAMGMTDAFDPEKADFSNITDVPLFISRVIHKTRIDVTPDGTSAGAATVLEFRCTSAAIVNDPKTVTLDRPFVYMLVDLETATPFFIGTMMSMN